MAMNVREEAEKRLLLEREKDEDVRRLQETLAREAEQARAEREAKVRKGHPSTLSLSVALCLSGRSLSICPSVCPHEGMVWARRWGQGAGGAAPPPTFTLSY